MLSDEIEFEIKRLPKGAFRATVHIFRGGRWWPPDSKLFVSELEAMRWINLRLALQGFEKVTPLTCKQFIERGVREKRNGSRQTGLSRKPEPGDTLRNSPSHQT
jgi:hypothetical protein